MLYLMKNELGLYKIGVSSKPLSRRSEISRNSGVNVDLLKVYLPDEDSFTIEQKLHKLLNEYRTVGEWFNFDSFSYAWFDEHLVQVGIDPKLHEKEFPKPHESILKKLLDYDPSKLIVEEYCKNLHDAQRKILSDLCGRKKVMYNIVINELLDKGYEVEYDLVSLIKEDKVSGIDKEQIKRIFCSALGRMPIVKKKETFSVREGYILHQMEFCKDQLHRLKLEMVEYFSKERIPC